MKYYFYRFTVHDSGNEYMEQQIVKTNKPESEKLFKKLLKEFYGAPVKKDSHGYYTFTFDYRLIELYDVHEITEQQRNVLRETSASYEMEL